MTQRIAPILLALAALGSACTRPNDASVEAFYVCAPAKDSTTCAPTGGTCETFLTGAANLWLQHGNGSDNGLFFYMELHNQRPVNGDESGGSVSTADAHVTGYELSYGMAGASIPGYTVSTIDVTIPAAGSATPFVTLLPVELSPVFQAALGSGEVRFADIFVKFKGHYADGYKFETGKFKVPTYLHNEPFPGYGCLKSTDIITDVCPNEGQTSTWTCTTP